MHSRVCWTVTPMRPRAPSRKAPRQHVTSCPSPGLPLETKPFENPAHLRLRLPHYQCGHPALFAFSSGPYPICVLLSITAGAIFSFPSLGSTDPFSLLSFVCQQLPKPGLLPGPAIFVPSTPTVSFACQPLQLYPSPPQRSRGCKNSSRPLR